MIHPRWAKHVGIPYKELNCWDHTCRVFKMEFGIDLPTYREHYADEAEKDEIRKLLSGEEFEDSSIDEMWRPIPFEEVREGDAALFSGDRRFIHTAVMIDKHTMIHSNKGTVYSKIDKLNNGYWNNVLIGYYRHKEMEDYIPTNMEN